MKTAYVGIIIHHSACPSINGKGYDYLIMKDGSILSSSEPFEPGWLHLCLEGDFSMPSHAPEASLEQFFLLQKLLVRLFRLHRLTPDHLVAHHDGCPGDCFPWNELVISAPSGYH